MTTPHPFRPTDGDRVTCADCSAPSGDHSGPFDDTANHKIRHDGLRSRELDGWTCATCAPTSGLAAIAAASDHPPTNPQRIATLRDDLDALRMATPAPAYAGELKMAADILTRVLRNVERGVYDDD